MDSYIHLQTAAATLSVCCCNLSLIHVQLTKKTETMEVGTVTSYIFCAFCDNCVLCFDSRHMLFSFPHQQSSLLLSCGVCSSPPKSHDCSNNNIQKYIHTNIFFSESQSSNIDPSPTFWHISIDRGQRHNLAKDLVYLVHPVWLSDYDWEGRPHGGNGKWQLIYFKINLQKLLQHQRI